MSVSVDRRNYKTNWGEDSVDLYNCNQYHNTQNGGEDSYQACDELSPACVEVIQGLTLFDIENRKSFAYLLPKAVEQDEVGKWLKYWGAETRGGATLFKLMKLVGTLAHELFIEGEVFKILGKIGKDGLGAGSAAYFIYCVGELSKSLRALSKELNWTTFVKAAHDVAECALAALFTVSLFIPPLWPVSIAIAVLAPAAVITDCAKAATKLHNANTHIQWMESDHSYAERLYSRALMDRAITDLTAVRDACSHQPSLNEGTIDKIKEKAQVLLMQSGAELSELSELVEAPRIAEVLKKAQVAAGVSETESSELGFGHGNINNAIRNRLSERIVQLLTIGGEIYQANSIGGEIYQANSIDGDDEFSKKSDSKLEEIKRAYEGDQRVSGLSDTVKTVCGVAAIVLGWVLLAGSVSALAATVIGWTVIALGAVALGLSAYGALRQVDYRVPELTHSDVLAKYGECERVASLQRNLYDTLLA